MVYPDPFSLRMNGIIITAKKVIKMVRSCLGDRMPTVTIKSNTNSSVVAAINEIWSNFLNDRFLVQNSVDIQSRLSY